MKALNYCKQGGKTVNENVAGKRYKAPATTAINANLHAWPLQTAADSIGSSLTLA